MFAPPDEPVVPSIVKVCVPLADIVNLDAVVRTL